MSLVRSPLDYARLAREMEETIAREKHVALATVADGAPVVRTMSYVNRGLTLFMQTDRGMDKCRQILANPRVALAWRNLRYDGLAALRGHPGHDEAFVQAFAVRHPGAFRRYTALADEVLLEVTPLLLVAWGYDKDDRPYRDFLDPVREQAWREYYRSSAAR